MQCFVNGTDELPASASRCSAPPRKWFCYPTLTPAFALGFPSFVPFHDSQHLALRSDCNILTSVLSVLTSLVRSDISESMMYRTPANSAPNMTMTLATSPVHFFRNEYMRLTLIGIDANEKPTARSSGFAIGVTAFSGYAIVALICASTPWLSKISIGFRGGWGHLISGHVGTSVIWNGGYLACTLIGAVYSACGNRKQTSTASSANGAG